MKRTILIFIALCSIVTGLLFAQDFVIEQIYRQISELIPEVSMDEGEHLYIVKINRSVDLPSGTTIYLHRQVPTGFRIYGSINIIGDLIKK